MSGFLAEADAALDRAVEADLYVQEIERELLTLEGRLEAARAVRDKLRKAFDELVAAEQRRRTAAA